MRFRVIQKGWLYETTRICAIVGTKGMETAFKADLVTTIRTIRTGPAE
jgi:hypothetical protein